MNSKRFTGGQKLKRKVEDAVFSKGVPGVVFSDLPDPIVLPERRRPGGNGTPESAAWMRECRDRRVKEEAWREMANFLEERIDGYRTPLAGRRYVSQAAEIQNTVLQAVAHDLWAFMTRKGISPNEQE